MYLLGLLSIAVFVAVLVLMAVFVRKLLRTAADITSESLTPISYLAWGSRLLAAITLIPAIVIAFAYIAGLFWNDQLVRKLLTVGMWAAFFGIAASLISTTLLAMPATRQRLPSNAVKNVISVNLAGFVSCVAVIYRFWPWVFQR